MERKRRKGKGGLKGHSRKEVRNGWDGGTGSKKTVKGMEHVFKKKWDRGNV